MAEIKGTNVASKIVPYTDSDEYATHDEKYGVGGYRTVDSVSEMNAIPAARRKEGMLVYVKNDRYYRLNSSNTFEDAGIGSSGGGGGSGLDWDSAHNFSQNGYQKFNNGLMLQWGTRAGATNGAINLYFPQSFYNTSYNIYFTGAVNNTSESFIYAPGYDFNGKYTSYCRVLTRGINSTPAIVWTSWNFTWFAIGRWK
jgi:hypothetical protein